MDFVTHSLTGFLLGEAKRYSAIEKGEIIFWSVLPDLVQIPLYYYLGKKNHRFLYWPLPEDWDGLPSRRPDLWLIWLVPHSLPFFLLFVAPLILLLRRPRMCLVAYLLHLVMDLPSHTGEFSMKPFYPLKYEISGIVDAWKWPWHYMFSVWVVLVFVAGIPRRLREFFG